MNTNKKVMVTALTISSLAVNVLAADNNFVGGTDNIVEAGVKSAGVVGYQNTIKGNNAVAFGENNIAAGTNSFAGGNNSKALGRDSFAYGAHAEAMVDYTVAIGSQARAATYNNIAVGNGAYSSGPNAISIGATTKSQSDNTIALGSSVTTSLNNSIGIGSIVNANGVSSVAIGHTVSTEGNSAVNIGNANVGASKYSTLIGSYNIVDHTDHLEDPEGDTLIGSTNIVQDGYYATVLGKDNEINNANYAVAIGRSASVTTNESVAIGHEAKANTVIGTTGATINNTNYIFAGGTPIGTVSVGDTGKERTLTNVSAGRISDVSTDAINGSQLYAAIGEINTNGQRITSVQNAVTNNTQRIDSIDTRIANNAIAIGTVNQRMNNLGANSAALSGLHPLDFNRNDKTSYAVSYGHYRNANAVALGAFYRPNERVMIGAGMTLGGENQYTLNVAFKTGKGSDYLAEAKGENARISQLEKLVEALTKEVNELKAK